MWAFFLILVSSLSFAGDLKCTVADGTLKFSSHSYSGGAAPAPGMLMSTTEWRYKNNSVYLARTYNYCDDSCETPEADPHSNISWSEIEGSKNIIFQEGGPQTYFTHTIYSVKVELQSTEPDVNMTGMEWEKYSAWFICDQFNAFYP